MVAMHVLRREAFWRPVILLGCWVVAVAFFSFPWIASDTLIHIKMGERILREPGFPRDDIFSYGETKPIESTQWLSEVLLYQIHHRYGEAGVRLLKTFLGLLTLLMVYRLARLYGAKFAGSCLAMLAAVFLTAYFLNARPRQFSLLLLVLFAALLHRSRDRPSLLLLYLPLKLLWVNLHGEYMVADGLLLICLAAGSLERLFPHLPASLAASPPQAKWLRVAGLTLLFSWPLNAANPYTRKVHSEEALSVLAPAMEKLLTEWIPLQWFNPLNYHVLAYLLTGLCLLALAYQKVSLTQAATLLALLLLPLLAQRAVPTMAVLTAPMLAALAAHVSLPRLRYPPVGARASPHLAEGWRLTLVFLFALIGSLYMLKVPFATHLARGLFNPELRPRAMHPVDAVHFLRLNRPPGRIYNDFDWGAYLIFTLYPDYQVASDARYTAVYREDYLQQAMSVMYGHPDWEKFLDKHKVNTVLIKTSRPLYGLLDRSQNWVWVYEDDWAAIFVRRSKATEPFLEKAFAWKLSYPREGIFERGFGAALVRRGEFERALDFLLRAEKKRKEDPILLDWMAVAYIGKGERGKALQALKKAIQVDPRYANAHAHLALWYVEEGQIENARRHAEEALRYDPANPIARDIQQALFPRSR